jgi:hypothetical protein
LFTSNRVFKQTEVVSKLHVCSIFLWEMWPSYTFHFSTRNLNSTHTKVSNIFFSLYMSRFPTINFQLWIISKLLDKHLSTIVSFKITTRKRHVYIDIFWPWIWNQCFYLGIWNDDRTKTIVLPSFQFATSLNSQNTNETESINELCTLFCLWILVFPIGIIEVSTSRKCCFWLYFSSLHDYWTRSTWNPLVHTSWSKMERCEKREFQLLKIRKK